MGSILPELTPEEEGRLLAECPLCGSEWKSKKMNRGGVDVALYKCNSRTFRHTRGYTVPILSFSVSSARCMRELVLRKILKK